MASWGNLSFKFADVKILVCLGGVLQYTHYVKRWFDIVNHPSAIPKTATAWVNDVVMMGHEIRRSWWFNWERTSPRCCAKLFESPPKFSKSDGPLSLQSNYMNQSCLESNHIYNYWYETYYYSIEVSDDLLVDWTCSHRWFNKIQSSASTQETIIAGGPVIAPLIEEYGVSMLLLGLK